MADTDTVVTAPGATEGTEISSTGGAAAADTTTNTDSDGAETPSAPVPEYKPDYKLKVYDEEKEIAQKYLGFDTVKTRHEKTKGEYQQFQSETKPIVEYYHQASNMLQKGNLEGFFDLLKIPDEVIFRYAVKKAEEAQLPVEQRQQIEYQKQIQRQKEYLESQNQTLQTQQQTQISEFRNQELNWVMSRPDVQSTSHAVDKMHGPGAFRQLVIEKGLAHFAKTGGKEDLTAEQAVTEVMKLIGPSITPAMHQGAPQNVQQTNGQPPIIPNVSGRSSSPVRKQVRSIADIKKRREELSSSS